MMERINFNSSSTMKKLKKMKPGEILEDPEAKKQLKELSEGTQTKMCPLIFAFWLGMKFQKSKK